MTDRLGINVNNAEGIALTLSTTFFSLLAIGVAPGIDGKSAMLKIAAALLGAVSLAAVFLFLRRQLNRIWAKPLLGVWLYRTQPHDESKRKELGFGVAEFSQTGDGDLHYRVDLYRKPEDALRAANGKVPISESHGTAVGLAQTFDPQSGALWILYQVQYYADTEPDREGHLYLRATGPSGHSVLRGSWASDLEGKLLSAGVMTMTRPDDFSVFLGGDAQA